MCQHYHGHKNEKHFFDIRYYWKEYNIADMKIRAANNEFAVAYIASCARVRFSYNYHNNISFSIVTCSLARAFREAKFEVDRVRQLTMPSN